VRRPRHLRNSGYSQLKKPIRWRQRLFAH